MTFEIRKVRLGEVCEIKQGRYLAPSQMTHVPGSEGDVPVIGGNGILGYTTSTTHDFDVPLVTCRGSRCGLMQWGASPSWISNNAMAVWFKQGSGDNRFLFHYLRQADFDSVITGSAQPQITVTSLSNLEISLPESRVQVAIGNFMDSLEAKISNNRGLIELLEQIAQTIFKSWFIDFDPVHAKSRGEQPEGMDAETAALFPDSFEDSELGLIPAGWSVKPLGGLLTPKKGKVITKANTRIGAVPVVAGGLEPAYYHDTSNVEGPVVTVSSSGANAGFVRLYTENIWASDCTYVSKTETDYVYFWYTFLKLRQNEIWHMQQGGAQPHIYASDLMRIVAAFPERETVIASFESLVSPFFKLIEIKTSENRTLSELRDSLLPRLISGELEILEELLDD